MIRIREVLADHGYCQYPEPEWMRRQKEENAPLLPMWIGFPMVLLCIFWILIFGALAAAMLCVGWLFIRAVFGF